MLDRQKLEAILRRRFVGASLAHVAAAANAIMGLSDEWEIVDDAEHEELHQHLASRCGDTCSLAQQIATGAEFRLFRRRT